jgi:hypothetical protein
MRSALLGLLLAFSLTSFGCKDDGEEAYDTLQDCFTDHTEEESLPVVEALVVCCLDHPIMGVNPSCGDTEADCINHLTDEIAQTDASTVEVMDACAEYVDQLGM